MKPLAATLLLVLSMGFLAGAGPTKPVAMQQTQVDPYELKPGGIRPSPATAVPGQQIDITLSLTEATTADQSVTVGVSDPGLFTSFPAYVIVPAGSDHVMFSVFVRSDAAPESLTLSASCNGTTISSPMAVGTALAASH